MSINDGPSPEMRLFARPGLGQPLSAADAERMLSGQGVGPDAPEELQALAMTLKHAAGPARTQELAGEISAVTAFALLKEQKTRRAEGLVRASDQRRQAGVADGRRRRRRPLSRPLIAAGASAAVVIALSGTAVAGALPAPMQRLAHDTFGAPAPQHLVPSPTMTPGVRRGQNPPVSPDTIPGKPTNSESPNKNGNGKAVGKTKSAKPKPTPHGVAKGHTAAHGHQ
jgi:hypothetical protein